jgi:hypothetical protein
MRLVDVKHLVRVALSAVFFPAVVARQSHGGAAILLFASLCRK